VRRSLALTAVAAAVSLAASSLAAEAPRPRPPVVIAIVVDQLGAWIADERWPTLPATGGLARLRREGTWAHALVYPYAVSDTAPGHAALFTGAIPRDDGIFANETVDDETRKRVSILRDEATHVVASDGPRDLPSSSLRALRVPTLADALRAARPDATIVALSLKDRAAIFGGGRAPTATVWFDASLGRWVTSSAFAAAFPPWALPFAGPDFLRAQLDHAWEPLDRDFVAAHAATPDEQPGEGDLDGFGAAFPHLLAKSADPAKAFRATPFADEALLALALAAVDARDRDQPMLLALSLSANDYVGHLFGPDSWEAWDELLRLDAALGRFFAALDERLGSDGWAALLAGDHGVSTMPEAAALARPWCGRSTPDRWLRSCAPPGRLIPDELAEELRAVAERTLGPGDWIAGIADPYVYLAPPARALDPAARRRLDGALTAALRAHVGVAGVWDARRPPARCRAADDVEARVCRSLTTHAPGELYMALQPGWFFDPDYVVGKGTSHGSPYLYDRAVPLLARAPGRIPAGRVVDAPVGPAAYARTAARLLGVPPPPGARDGRDLTAR
jgi:arylsulfatase A-like enzyme